MQTHPGRGLAHRIDRLHETLQSLLIVQMTLLGDCYIEQIDIGP
jgi:hypothetical protein